MGDSKFPLVGPIQEMRDEAAALSLLSLGQGQFGWMHWGGLYDAMVKTWDIGVLLSSLGIPENGSLKMCELMTIPHQGRLTQMSLRISSCLQWIMVGSGFTAGMFKPRCNVTGSPQLTGSANLFAVWRTLWELNIAVEHCPFFSE